MIAVLVINLLLVASALMLSNERLMLHGYVLYAAEALVLLPYLARRMFSAHHLFMPSVFALTSYLANLALGGYLVPRDHGWNNEYTDIARAIEHDRVIVPSFLAVNVILFLVTCHTVRQLATTLKRSIVRRSRSSGLVSIGCIEVSRRSALDRLSPTRGSFS